MTQQPWGRPPAQPPAWPQSGRPPLPGQPWQPQWNQPGPQAWAGQQWAPPGQFPPGQFPPGQFPPGQFRPAPGQFPPPQGAPYQAPRAAFPQQPGFPAPYQQAPGPQVPRPPQRGGGARGVLFALVVVGVLIVGGLALSSLAPSRPTAGGTTTGGTTTGGTTTGGTTTGGTTTGGTTTGGSTTTTTTQPDTYRAPPPDMSPPQLPAPETYTEATDWLEQNKVYQASIAAPTNCSMKPIDALGASTAELQAHLQALTACMMKVWAAPLSSRGFVLPRPPATVYTAPINTACGKMDKVNASYCGADQRIYYAKPLPKIFPENLQRANFLMEMILAHEFGHTIQARTGIIISEMAWEQKVGKPAANVFSRRLEMQADCLAGMFTKTVAPSQGLSAADISTLKELAFNLGDDVLTGDASIDSGHGRGKNRQAWYTKGLEGSLSIGQCNTFTVSPSAVR